MQTEKVESLLESYRQRKMTNVPFVLTVSMLTIILLYFGIAFTKMKKANRESFKVLGTLAPYAKQYYRCLSECEKQDPSKRLIPNRGSLMCEEYCNSVLTEASRQPANGADNVFSTAIDESFNICGEGRRAERCQDIMSTSKEIDEYCQRECEYYPSYYNGDSLFKGVDNGSNKERSPQAEATCMNSCKKSKRGNYSIGWSWK